MSITAQDHVQVVERFFECLSRGELEGALECFHEDNVIHEPPGLPYGGDYHGRAGVQELVAKVTALFGFEINRWDVRAIGENEAVGILDARFTSHETGRRLDLKVVELYTFTDGLISDAVIFPQDTRAIHELTLPEATLSA